VGPNLGPNLAPYWATVLIKAFIHAALVSVAVRDEFSGMETVMKSVMEAVGGKSSRRVSPLAKPSKIIPGAQTFEDLEAFLKRKKDAKLEEMKKKK